jgi:hypothetical protein
MSQWLKANGGPPAVIILGIGFLFGNVYFGVVVMAIGVLLWCYHANWFPIVIQRKRGRFPTDDVAVSVDRARPVAPSSLSLTPETAVTDDGSWVAYIKNTGPPLSDVLLNLIVE